MNHRLICLSLACISFFAAVARAEDAPNPAYAAWEKYNVGSSARYVGNTKTMGLDTTIETRVTLSSKNPSRVVLDIERKVTTTGEAAEESTETVEVPAKLPSTSVPAMVGEEDLQFQGKTYRCRVYLIVETKNANTKSQIAMATRTWMNDQFPGGVLKVDSKTEGPIALNTQIDLKEYKVK